MIIYTPEEMQAQAIFDSVLQEAQQEMADINEEGQE